MLIIFYVARVEIDNHIRVYSDHNQNETMKIPFHHKNLSLWGHVMRIEACEQLS